MARTMIDLDPGRPGERRNREVPRSSGKTRNDQLREWREPKHPEEAGGGESTSNARKIITVIVILSLVLLSILVIFRIMGIIEEGRNGEGNPQFQDRFNGGSQTVLVNTTFLGTDVFFDLPEGAEIETAMLSLSGALPPQRTTYQAGRNPSDLAVGDLNGDLYPDVVVVNNKDGTLMVLMHDGHKLVRDSVHLAGDGATRVILGQFNNDTFPDAAVISEDSREVRFFINDRLGSFRRSGEPYKFPTLPSDLASLDFDGDGDTDVAVLTTNNDKLNIFENDGLGGFRYSLNITTEGNPTRLTVADYDLDGLNDLIISNRRDMSDFGGEPHQYYDLEKDRLTNWLSTVSFWRNIGSPSYFQRELEDLRSEKGVSNIAAEDINGDGYPDLVMANLGYHNVTMMLSDGEGDFERKAPTSLDLVSLESMDPTQVKLFDLEGDGDLDIIAVTKSADSVLLYTNDGGGRMDGPVQYYVGLNPTSFDLLDFDSDGDMDIVTSDWKGWIEKNGDNGTVSILYNYRSGIFGAYRQYRTGNSPRGVFTRDVDGDGDVEIATANYFGSTVSIHRNDGLGDFSSSREYPIGLEPYAVVMEDFDGDGNMDGASADEANFRIVLLRSDGSGGFTKDRYLYDIGAYPFSLRTGDIDGDGDMDLYTSNYFQNSTTLLFNDGSGNFSSMFTSYKTIYLGPNMPYDSIIEDVNGDGKKDLITVNRGDTLSPSDTISVMLNKGSYDFNEMETYTVGKEPTSAVIIDFDKDGDEDVITANTGDDTISVMLNNGFGEFFKLNDYTAGDRPQYVNYLDFDEDGWEDIVATNTDSNDLVFLRNNRGKGLERTQALNIGSYPFAVDSADFNKDGRMDMAITIVNTNNVLVLGCYWYPQDISIDVGADGTIEKNYPGLFTEESGGQIDITEAVKEYLSDHKGDGDTIKVPIKVIAGKEGIVVLSDLLIVYR
ncbi:MAG: FG-GAP repeat domain-containing protein [Thermoplasmatota archaeon]